MSQIENSANAPKKSALASWYRQPKIYVRLPSGGRFYPPGSLDKSENEEYAVYAMTAKDELMFKTPDALLSGQSTVEVIKSCFPAILDPWKMPSIDLDFALIAIRIATYGDTMSVDVDCPHCTAANSYDVNLNDWIQIFNNFTYESVIESYPLSIHVRPYNYKEVTKASIKTLEQQKLFSIINDEEISDEEKLDRFGVSFVRLTELTVDIIADCITRIDTPDGFSEDKSEIKEFINNCSKDIFDKIQNHITNIKETIEFKARDVQCGDCGKPFQMPITMDQSNFFGARS